ncbi:unnamed protein product, partial [Iphiclides podalirius]
MTIDRSILSVLDRTPLRRVMDVRECLVSPSAGGVKNVMRSEITRARFEPLSSITVNPLSLVYPGRDASRAEGYVIHVRTCSIEIENLMRIILFAPSCELPYWKAQPTILVGFTHATLRHLFS